MSFPALLMNREIGLPRAQLSIEETLDQKTANHMANDSFHSDIIELPENSSYRTYRCQNVVAILGMKNDDPKVQSLAVWSTITKRKLWELTIQQAVERFPDSCILSESGMVLIEDPTTERKIIVIDGKQSGVLPKFNWNSIVPVGMRILGCWTERILPNHSEPFWYPGYSRHYFAEYNHEGRSLNRYLLDIEIRRLPHAYACDEQFWVRLSGSHRADCASLIEVIDRVIGKMNTFELPLCRGDESFSSACIVQNRLLYGKNRVSYLDEHKIVVNQGPSITIFDLVRGGIIEEFQTGAVEGKPIKLVATQYYAAWLMFGEGYNESVRYLDILNRTVKIATTIPREILFNHSKISLSIVGTILSVIYPQGSSESALWRRKVIDMTNGEVRCDISYKRSLYGECSIANGNMLISDDSLKPPSMYFESFIGEGISSKDSDFRVGLY